MELARRDEVRLTNEDRKVLRQQVKLDRELADHHMKMEREAAQARALQAAEDRKQQRQADLDRKAAEAKKEKEREDRAEAQQRSRQMFELAMLKAMGMAVTLPGDGPAGEGSGPRGP
ncbi:uncharacterized protein PGTG_21561 [Puccinia graminis f. sp. tritici CRL 75-36-700-3]|uniref:Uncharacterized protein n=1 Tax=Puccinia graminis f. sp. tritici (strain CRL 75-36-700-3 / race SCCL) TaxID=418459 RepID=H6QRZ3_PUCGT|nr:uncharacterized protein PGTG_21561 [Puccinia graminis f. sp. tritici CRL 75-36-700-3]EHS63428.1 hypothetical protein PGTG_21561 [Puccinia graminis f. sp. tritici CRL 75-36-700-3]